VFNGDTAQLKKLQEKFQSYDKTNYFTEFGDFVLGIGKIGDTTEVLEKRHKDAYYTYGTKWWEFDLDDHEEGAEDFTIAGDSAWSPPINLVERICMVYNLTAQMEYEENGMNFAGYVEFNNLGITTNREMSADEYAYENDKSNWIENTKWQYEGESMENVDVQKEHSYASPKHIKELLEAINEFKM
jgi:hypothetical protein